MIQFAKEIFRLPPHFILILIIISISGCGILSSDGNPSLKITTEHDTYDLSEDEYISVEIVNTSDQSIYYSTCLAKELEIIDSGELVESIPFGVCYCYCSSRLEPGEKVEPNVSKAFIANLKENPDQLMLNENVSYRLKYEFYDDETFGDELLPDNQLRSNEFNLILSD
tara:strand:- start:228 stop:734 length:507 start_codon:yes stop_codon:yes gene_type:complete